MVEVECPECWQQFEAESDVLFLSNRLHCSLCDALLEAVEEDPLVLDVVDEQYYHSEGEEADDDDREAEWSGRRRLTPCTLRATSRP